MHRDAGKPVTTGLLNLTATSADPLGLTAPSGTACTPVDPHGRGSGHLVRHLADTDSLAVGEADLYNGYATTSRVSQLVRIMQFEGAVIQGAHP